MTVCDGACDDINPVIAKNVSLTALFPYFFTLSYHVALLPLSPLFCCHKEEKELA
jgi:hypothetical protein